MRGIFFQGHNALAIREGRKTVTRRAVCPQPPPGYEFHEWVKMSTPRPYLFARFENKAEPLGMWTMRCPYGVVGTQFRVREPFRFPADCDDKSPAQVGALALEAGWERPWAPVRYEADGAFASREEWNTWHQGTADPSAVGRLRSPLFMPSWASRTTLELTAIDVKRLWTLTEEDAKAEGVIPHTLHFQAGDVTWGPHRLRFYELWNEINGQRERSKFAWESNPYVWVLSFKVVS